MTTRLDAFNYDGEEGQVLKSVKASIKEKIDILKDFDTNILDVSIREPTAYSAWSHRLSDKMDIFREIRKFGFKDILLGDFEAWDTVDEQFCKLVKDEDKDRCFVFSTLGKFVNGQLDLSDNNSIILKKAAALAPNVLFEFSIAQATEAEAEATLENFDLSCQWIRQAWADRNIGNNDRKINGRIYINIYDTFEAFYEKYGNEEKKDIYAPDFVGEHRDIYIRVIQHLAKSDNDVDGLLFEDELGTSFHFQVGELTRFLRKMAPKKKILAHLHDNSGTMYASALEVAINGGNGLWAGFTPIGGMLNNAASSVFLASLLRVGNTKVNRFEMETMIPTIRKLDRFNEPSPTDFRHPVIGEGSYLSTLRVFEQRAGEPMSVAPEQIGAKRGFRVVPAIANNYALSNRLKELDITDPSMLNEDDLLDEALFNTMWDLMQQTLIAGKKVDCNSEAVLREYLDRARQINDGHVPYVRRGTRVVSNLGNQVVSNLIKGFQAEYFSNTNLEGSPIVKQTTNINFNWGGTDSPDPAIPNTNFSARWTGVIAPKYSETYTFTTTSDDGIRVWVNNQPLIDDWTTHGAKNNTASIELTANMRYEIRVEYYQGGGGSVAKLYWSSPSQAQDLVYTSGFQPNLTFDGKGDYVEVPNAPNLTQAITVSCWAKSTTPTWNSTYSLVSKRNSFTFGGQAGNKNLVFYIFSTGAWRYTAFTLDIDITEWHHYAGTFDGHSIRLYVDGDQVARAEWSGTIAPDNGSLFVGWDDGIAEQYFGGQITEVRLWDHARIEQEIKGDMRQRLVGNEAHLVGYWPLDEGSGTIANDKTANGTNGEINGTTWS